MGQEKYWFILFFLTMSIEEARKLMGGLANSLSDDDIRAVEMFFRTISRSMIIHRRNEKQKEYEKKDAK